uniref:Indole-3-pyruvic acid (IPA) decarboxylase n=1 Tax=Tricholoma vaccinum TaxID=56470 RepID=A0A0C5LQ52_9AGAR|nr:indole-3-pyruvic acid (IPA) decarboxylase [Tricholoma vaccinum]
MSSSEATLQAEVDRLRNEVQVLKEEQLGKSTKISIGNYILARLEQLGITVRQSMFGVPGDFNLGFLVRVFFVYQDLVEEHPTIDWVGNWYCLGLSLYLLYAADRTDRSNELNAAYAADGYARVKESIGVVLTTFGVGELSAINGIAGAFSEMVPVLHLVGVPSTAQQKDKPMLHHTLGDGRYVEIRHVTFFHRDSLLDTTHMTRLQNNSRIRGQARPVYLSVPTNLVLAKISSAPLRLPLNRNPPRNSRDEEAYVLDIISKQVEAAGGDVVVLVDACTIRHGVREEVNDFLRKTGFPVYAAPMGRTAIDEDYERFGGVYMGSITKRDVKRKVEFAKLILSIGSLKSDYNTGNFSYNIPTQRTIEYAMVAGVGMKELLPKLTEKLVSYRDRASHIEVPRFFNTVPNEGDDKITHSWFWPRVGDFLKPKDVIITETGTSNFGLLEVPLPPKSTLVNQVLWGSIGWATGDTLGASLAAREKGFERTILFTGDGSLQLTVQELSVMIRKGVKPIIFVLNNSGYTIERCIHGKTRKYNDISNWNWTALFSVFGDPDERLSSAFTVNTKGALSKLLDDATFAKAGKIQLVEVMMDKFDAPRALQEQAALSA